MNSFNNFNLYIFLFIYLLYLCIYFYKRLTNIKDNNNIFELVDKYYISNLYYDSFILGFYFLMVFLIFMIYRITLFNKEVYVEYFDSISLNYSIVFTVILFLLTIHYYIKILDLLFQDYLIKIHFYLTQYTWYVKLNDFERNHYQWISNNISDLWSYITDKTISKKEFVHLYYIPIKNKGKDVYNSKEYKSWEKAQNNKYLLYFYNFIAAFLYILSQWVSLFLYYLLHSTVFLVFLYDIDNGKLYYIYYMLAIYFLMKFIRKVRDFIQIKDCVYDDIIMKYFYKNNIAYEDIINKRKKSEMCGTIAIYEEEIKRYIKNNFQVHYIIDPYMVKNRKRNHNFAKRLNIIFLLILGVLYNYIHHEKYLVYIHTYELSLNCILIPIVIILSYANYQLFYFPATREKVLEYKPYLWLFRLIFLAIILPILYIILKNKITIMPNEILFSYGDNIKLLEVFSMEEKDRYLERYTKYLQRILVLDPEIINNVILKVKPIIIQENITLQEIRNSVEEILSSMIKAKMPLTLAELVLNWWEKLLKIFKK